MPLADKTELFAAPPIKVKILRGTPLRSKDRFAYSFRLGRGEDCDIRFSDPRVSTEHAGVSWEDEKWWLKDLGSRNGTFLDGVGVSRCPLPPQAKVELALGGPVVELEIDSPHPKVVARIDRVDRPVPPEPVEQTENPAGPDAGMTHITERYFTLDSTRRAGEQTRLIRQAFHRVRKKQSRRYWAIIGIVALFLVATLAALYYQTRRVKKLEELHATAENVFYTAKTIELQLARLQSRLGPSPDPQLTEMQRQERQMEAIYDGFLDELGISKANLSEEDWLIYKVARLFGECTVSMPKGYVETVKRYIGYWRRTPLYATGIARAKANGYPARIRDIMLERGMPPQFFYLALQESGFNKDICGPMTGSGIAKGIWQFIPATAYKYHLHTGPLVDVRKADPLDERHNFEKSTVAASAYLHDLYQGEAQASGLLVMACYNWNETRIRGMLGRMPENPRDRNFWKLLGSNMIPQETYDYVFSIIAASVIGENPRLFGFDFDNPID